jgi:hypothetical protein
MILFKFFYIKNKKRLIINFINNEIIEVLISIYVWKGVWDLYDIGMNDLFDIADNQILSIVLSGLFGYALFFILIFVNYKWYSSINSQLVDLNSSRTKSILRTLKEDIFYTMMYISLVAIWRTWWNGYDLIINENSYTIFITHFVTIVVCFMTKSSNIIYGPSGSFEFQNEFCLKIKYFSK